MGVQTASSLARPGTDPARQGGWRARIPTVFAATLTVLAVLCAVAAVSEALNQRTQPVRMIVNVLVLPAPANLGYAALVAVLAGGVSRRKRVAYVFLLIYFGLQVAYDVLLLGLIATLAPGDWDSAPPPWYAPWEVGGNLLLTLGVLVVLYLARGQFYARVQRGSLRRALGVLAVLLTFSALYGSGDKWRIAFILALFFWTNLARIVRGVFLSLREKEYVEAAKAAGAGDARIMARHMLPNSIGPIVVNATLTVGQAILVEAALAFLGLGIQPPTPALGALVFVVMLGLRVR